MGRVGVRFSVLGPVEVSAGERQLPRATPRHRSVLAYLLLHPGTVISAERLIGAIWGVTPPDTARSQIHAAITGLRRVLRAAGADDVLATRAAGYVIRPEPGQLDLAEFTDGVAEAARLADGDPEDAVRRIRAALDLWRGQPLADVNADYVEATRARLEDRRLAAVERLAELELALGRHADLVDELSAHVAAHPLREKLTAHLVLALHRAGRQHDALAAARRFRAALADEHGLDPSRAFTALEQRVLRDDPALAFRPTPPSAEEPARTAHRRANYLPYDTPDFTGRVAEMDDIAGAGEGTVRIWAIDGMAGVGKTTLAIHAANRLVGAFPDGQFFVDLQAHTAGRPPLATAAAAEILLRQLGVPADRPPTDPAAVWRAELADRRALVVLDNAADADQVRPLLPGASAGLVVITSRKRLVGLDGAQVLSLEPLPAEDCLDLFTTIVGERADAEPLAVLDVLQLCGFLPLAVRIAAARLRHRPRWTVRYLASRLRDQRGRLTELATADRGVAAAFALSYEQLDPEQRRMFRLLGLHPGRDLDARAAAALADVGWERAEELMEELLDAHMLLQHEPGRYTLHDLLREHARNTTEAQDGHDVRKAAVDRVVEHYLRAADTVIAQPGSAGADAWLAAERANLIAVAAQATDRPQATALHRFLYDRAHHTQAFDLYAEALATSRARGDRPTEARALVDMGWVYWRQCRYAEAADQHREALRLGHELGDRHVEARAEQGLGHVCLSQEQAEQARDHYLRALRRYRELGDRAAEGAVLGAVGRATALLGDLRGALALHHEALQVYRGLDDRDGVAEVLEGLGSAHRCLGEHEQASARYERALTLYRETGYRSGEASALNGLGEVALAAGDHASAADRHRAALVIADEIAFAPEQARARAGLARASVSRGAAGSRSDAPGSRP
jgi:DNA-binding SARP family transcriptional activator/tetratricopeptide (TPR) repeat protein